MSATAYLAGGPANSRIIELSNPSAKVLMLIDRHDVAAHKAGETNVIHIYRYERADETVHGHTAFLYTEGDTL